MKYSRVLITGGCGAIGSEVVNRLKSRHPQTHFINLDALTYAGNPDNVEPPFDNYTFVHGDITDVDTVTSVLATHKPDAIIHLAAETHVDNSFGNSFRFTHTNVMGTHVLLECAKRYMATSNPLGLFLHMSTDEVYGSVDDDQPPCHERSLFQPSNPYSASKAAAEMVCHAYQQSFKLPLMIMRCNNAVSKYQHPEKLIPRVVQSLRHGERIPIHGEGKSKRTFIHAYDISDAIETIIEKGELGHIYNIGSEMEYTVLEVVQTILNIMRPGEPIEDHIQFVPDRAFQDYRYSIDTSTLRLLGWDIRMSFMDAIQDVIGGSSRPLTPFTSN